MFYEKFEAFVAACSLLSALLGGLVSNIIKSTKEKAQFVTRKELDVKLRDYALRSDLEGVQTTVEQGFDRIEQLYHQDKVFQHEREMALVKRIDEILNK